MKRIGALEAGGTKMVMGVFDEAGNELIRRTIPTEKPETVLPIMKSFFDEQCIDALGIGSFGPLDLNKKSATYGNITSTPKPGWRDVAIYDILSDHGRIPTEIDTDVNAAALAEVRLGAAQGCENAIYVTIGTGIGGGVILNGRPLHGLVHPEIGHMLMRPVENDPMPEGICPYHKSCLEGLASGPALGKRINGNAEELPDHDPIFSLEANYLAQMCANLIMAFSPEKIVLGGGVMARNTMLDLIRHKTLEYLGGYVQHPTILKDMDHFIVTPDLYPVSGLVGSWLLGMEALHNA